MRGRASQSTWISDRDERVISTKERDAGAGYGDRASQTVFAMTMSQLAILSRHSVAYVVIVRRSLL